MDDDLELVSGWLDALVDTLETTQSDVAVGPLRPRFPGNRPPEWDVDGERFTRVLDRATGSLIAASGPDKPPGFALSTASSLWRRATCFTDATPFDPTFGASGGEDFDLFLRLDRRGRRFVWCAEGGVIETVPPNRMDIGYQRLKAYSAGTVYAAVSINNASSKLLAALDIGIRGFIQAIMFGTAGAVLTALSQFGVAGLQTRAASLIFAALTGWGKVTWWRRVALYHVEKSPS
jgi:succinoglycan biosynthesis protein ExoM